MGGYVGQIAYMDLSKGTITINPMNSLLKTLYLGGRGISSKLLFDNVCRDSSPYDSGNCIIVSTGPLVGTLGPSTGRFTVAARSPLTGILGDANSGGHFGPELKYAGFDVIVIKGRSPRPCYIYIEDGNIEIRDARDIWGSPVIESEKRLKEQIGDEEAHALVIGPAGESLVRYAAVINDAHRAAGRCGIGAIFGSKNLKGIIARGNGEVCIDNVDAYMDIVKMCFDAVYDDPVYPTLSEIGTPFLMDSAQEDGGLATRNNQSGVFEKYGSISQEEYTSKYKSRSFGCFSCPIHCANITKIERNGAVHIGGGPEYESLVCLGSKCGLSSLPAIIEANNLCNDLGLDTISCGDSIAFAMELLEKNINYPQENANLTWGNEEEVISLVSDIAYRRGLGDLLAEGVLRASSTIGKGAEKYALHVKGMEVPAFDARAAKGFALGWAVSSRGADHLRALPNFELLGFSPEDAIERFNSPYSCNPYEERGKAEMVVWHENFCAVVDSAEMCKYAAFSTYAITPDMLSSLLTSVTGNEYSGKNLLTIGERILTLEKILNISFSGIMRDTLPSRFLHDKLPGGPAKGNTVNLEPMLDEYYSYREWNDSGAPTKSCCVRLGLEKESDKVFKLMSNNSIQ